MFCFPIGCFDFFFFYITITMYSIVFERFEPNLLATFAASIVFSNHRSQGRKMNMAAAGYCYCGSGQKFSMLLIGLPVQAPGA